MMNVNDFAHIGLFFVSAFFFAFATGLVGGIITKFGEDCYFVAWLIAIVIYGITFAILYQIG